MRRLLAALAVTVTLTACSPEVAIRVIFGEDADEALAVAGCESGLDPDAVSPGGGNHGLFQINSVHRRTWESFGWSWAARYDPVLNTAFAKWLYDRQGWEPWTCRP